MSPPLRPAGVSIKPIPSYTVPHPHPPLLASISAIPTTWRSDLLSSIPPNLSDWFIPITEPNHWEVYKSPIFPENEGKWRFEYKAAFAKILAQFDEEFVDSFKIITGIGVGSRWKGMVDLMELIDCIEGFIDRVKMKSSEAPPSLQRSDSIFVLDEPVPPTSSIPMRNLQFAFLTDEELQPGMPLLLPEYYIPPSPSSGNSRFSRMFGGWLFPQHQRAPDQVPSHRSLQEAQTTQEIEVQSEPAEVPRVLQRYPRIERQSTEDQRDKSRIRYFQSQKRRRNRTTIYRLKTYPGIALRAVLKSPAVAVKAVMTSPAKIHRQWTRVERSTAYLDLKFALGSRRRGIIKKYDQASKVIITSPKKIINRCGVLLQLRKQPEPEPVRTPSPPAPRPITPVRPPPRKRSPPIWVPPPGGPPHEFRDFMKGIGWPV